MPVPLPGQTPEQASKHSENAPVSDLHWRYPDLLGARVAMQWAAEAARKLAEQTEMALVVGEPGRERGLPDVGEAIDSQWVGNG